MKNFSKPLLDWVSQTLSPLKCLQPWSATFVLSMLSPIHHMLMQRNTNSTKSMPHRGPIGDKPLEKKKKNPLTHAVCHPAAED